ncbi:putative periplasmic beta-glucosidase [Selenomonas ruminantium subsp. lactilytica TAM6421]|uniref:beta-glucosidase n=1 Tax=Selenomonas ruminantium subsp. lactilytica (strain NBRC 103574 / TAM6421) TaxID=927704 RepID=I0GT87_SELRL|nr:glycoside hydrolase family 3 N-terminal domain-containing protein [Selenomonas ruminantium]BAL83974.1 putative periplasmic beta-glucosidase [Selenomonas ruminantium subsp. lactilytica TAM6421]
MKKQALTLAIGLTLMGTQVQAADFTEKATVDGYTLVEQKGAELAYSPDSGVKLLQVDGKVFKDMNRNGKLDAYEDWRLTPQKRAEDLAKQLSTEDIAGLMLYSMHQRNLQPQLNEEQKKMLSADHVRTVLNADSTASNEVTAKWNNALQAYAESLPFAIPANTSSDPRSDARGNGVYLKDVTGGVSRWPSNLGIAATFNPAIAKEFGEISSKEYRLLGIGTGLSPQIDLATDPRWTRYYGTFGEDPALARDMAKATMDGVQSTIEKGKDMGWGKYSVNAMMKHWPGDGVGEGGREAHSKYGKYAVYPGGQFNTQLIPFVDGGLQLDGKTKMPSAVMSSYSIAWSDDGSLGEKVGSAFSRYKIGLLRDKYHYDGVICTDWCVTHDIPQEVGKGISTAWGVEKDTEVIRHYKALMAGVDQFGGNNDIKPVLAAYEMGVKEHGKDYMDKRFQQSAVRLLRNIFQIGLFENPYLDVAKTVQEVGNPHDKAAGYKAQLASIVMLKNKGNVIHQAGAQSTKPVVYIPMIFRPAQENKTFHTYSPAHWSLPVDLKTASEYFTVVTDKVRELTAKDRDGKPMAAVTDIERLAPAEVAKADMVLAVIDNPTNAGNQFDGLGCDEQGNFIPLSLQYKPYTADSAAVRKASIAHDEGENRSYFGRSARIINATDLDGVAYGRECAAKSGKDMPVVTMVHALKPMIFSEVEPLSDAILVGYGVSDAAYFDILTGKFEPQGLLPMQQPKDMETVERQFEDTPRDMECYTDSEGHTYDFAYGLDWKGQIKDARTAKYAVPALKK